MADTEVLKCSTYFTLQHGISIHHFLSFRLTLKGVFEAVEQRTEMQKDQGKNLYYLMQKYLILDDMESLLHEAHVWLNDGIAPHLLRCLTHVVLFLRKIGLIPHQLEPQCIDILEACVKVSGRHITFTYCFREASYIFLILTL